MEMAAAYPTRVNKLVLSSLAYAEPEAQRERYNSFRNKGMVIKEDGSHLMDLWKERSRPHMTLEMVQRAIIDYLRSGLGVRTEDGHRALFSYDFGAKLPVIISHTLLLYGAADTFLHRLEATKSAIPKCWTKIIEGTRSYPTWEKPQEFAQAVLEFLENQGS